MALGRPLFVDFGSATIRFAATYKSGMFTKEFPVAARRGTVDGAELVVEVPSGFFSLGLPPSWSGKTSIEWSSKIAAGEFVDGLAAVVSNEFDIDFDSLIVLRGGESGLLPDLGLTFRSQVGVVDTAVGIAGDYAIKKRDGVNQSRLEELVDGVWVLDAGRSGSRLYTVRFTDTPEVDLVLVADGSLTAEHNVFGLLLNKDDDPRLTADTLKTEKYYCAGKVKDCGVQQSAVLPGWSDDVARLVRGQVGILERIIVGGGMAQVVGVGLQRNGFENVDVRQAASGVRGAVLCWQNAA